MSDAPKDEKKEETPVKAAEEEKKEEEKKEVEENKEELKEETKEDDQQMGQPKKEYDPEVLKVENRKEHGHPGIEKKCWSDRVHYTPPPSYKEGRQQHRPYGKDVDANLKKLITEAFDKEENKDLDAVC